MKIKIEGCHDCPLLHDNDMGVGEYCAAANNGKVIISYHVKMGSPEWCPLKQEAVTIKLTPPK